MKLKLYYLESVHENAARYYEQAKEARQKLEGLEKAIEETRKEMERVREKPVKEVRVKREKQWFEKFVHSFSSSGKLMIGGRNAQQNDIIVSRHMDDDDLFFHADIQGGSVFILKGGAGASEQEMREAAQMAACFSKAWANANAAVDVYSVKKGQLAKHATGGFVPTGAFAITGTRTWFKGTRLAMRIGLGDQGLEMIPEVSERRLQKELTILPSKKGKEKGGLAKSLAKRYAIHPDDLLELLPNGRSKTVQE